MNKRLCICGLQCPLVKKLFLAQIQDHKPNDYEQLQFGIGQISICGPWWMNGKYIVNISLDAYVNLDKF